MGASESERGWPREGERASERASGRGRLDKGRKACGEETVETRIEGETRMKDEEGGAAMLERNKWRKNGKMGMR